MANESADKKKPAKRRLRPASESVREKAATARESAAKDTGPGYGSAFWRGFSWPFRKISNGFARLGKFRVFRFLAKILFLSYVVNSWRELKLVVWPNRRQTWQLTSAVIIFSVIFGAIIAGVDFGLDKLFKEIVLKK